MGAGSRACGVLVVDKPVGRSSFGVVKVVRQALGVRKVGHTGTLDPLATGVLALCVGEATKLAGMMLAADKEYDATAELGVHTDSYDLTGEVLERGDASGVTRPLLEEALGRFRGRLLQVPPPFSAVHKDGKRAYELARRGEQVRLEPREIEVFALDLLRWAPPRAQLRVHCSKGTYIRSMVADLGRQLGCGATLAALRRRRSGVFTLADAVSLEAVQQRGRQQPLLSVDRALGELPAVELAVEDLLPLSRGQQLSAAGAADARLVRARCRGRTVALGELCRGVLQPRRLLLSEIERAADD